MNLQSFNFECTACGRCCTWGGWLCLYPEDVRRAAGFLKIGLDEFVRTYTRHITVEYRGPFETSVVPYLALNVDDGRCVFLDGKLCRIHEAKPEFCRATPLVAEFLLEPDGWNRLHEGCEGMGRGAVVTRPEIDEALERQASMDMDYEELLAENDWNLERILGVSLPDPEPIPDVGEEIFSE